MRSLLGRATGCSSRALTVDAQADVHTVITTNIGNLQMVRVDTDHYIITSGHVSGPPFSNYATGFSFDGTTLAFDTPSQAFAGSDSYIYAHSMTKSTTDEALLFHRDFDVGHSPNNDLESALLTRTGTPTITYGSGSTYDYYSFTTDGAQCEDDFIFFGSRATDDGAANFNTWHGTSGFGTGGGVTAPNSTSQPIAICKLYTTGGVTHGLALFDYTDGNPRVLPFTATKSTNVWSALTAKAQTLSTGVMHSCCLVRVDDSHAIALTNTTGVKATLLTVDGSDNITVGTTVTTDLDDNARAWVSGAMIDDCNCVIYGGYNASNYPQFQPVKMTVGLNSIEIAQDVATGSVATTPGTFGIEHGNHCLLPYAAGKLVYVQKHSTENIVRIGTVEG